MKGLDRELRSTSGPEKSSWRKGGLKKTDPRKWLGRQLQRVWELSGLWQMLAIMELDGGLATVSGQGKMLNVRSQLPEEGPGGYTIWDGWVLTLALWVVSSAQGQPAPFVCLLPCSFRWAPRPSSWK